MKRADVIKQYTTPLGAPGFPRGHYRFTNREYLNITYRTDIDVLREIVPEPLEIDDPLVRFEVMNMSDTTGLGSYVECGQAVIVRLGDEKGDTCTRCIWTELERDRDAKQIAIIRALGASDTTSGNAGNSS